MSEKEKPFREETEEEIIKFFGDVNFAHFIGMFAPPRPGVVLCATQLEHVYYPPGGEINEDFMIRLWKWEEIIWAIISVPRSDIDLVRKIAAECGLSVKHGVPQKITMLEMIEIMAARDKRKISPKEKKEMEENKELYSKVELLVTDIVRDKKTSARRKVFTLPYNNRVFTFENIKNHPFYKNDPETNEKIRQLEFMESARISTEFEMLRIKKQES